MQLSDSFQEQLAQKLGQLNEAGATARPADSRAADDKELSSLGRIALLVEKLTGFEAQKVSREHSAADLGLDSLDRIELAVRLEQATGVQLDDREVAALTTVGELADHLDRRA